MNEWKEMDKRKEIEQCSITNWNQWHRSTKSGQKLCANQWHRSTKSCALSYDGSIITTSNNKKK